jgi:hypothetical protein
VPEAFNLEEYKAVPDFFELDITKEVIKKVTQRLSSSAGPGGLDAQAIQHWLL